MLIQVPKSTFGKIFINYYCFISNYGTEFILRLQVALREATRFGIFSGEV